jgi:hypothetical protein
MASLSAFTRHLVPGAAIVLAAAALVVSLAGGRGRTPPRSPPPDERVARLRSELREISLKVDRLGLRAGAAGRRTGPAAPAPGRPDEPDAEEFRSLRALPEEAPWPVIARRLTADLRLENAQVDALDRALEQCERTLAGLREERDAKRARSLAKLARRRAYRSVERALGNEQRRLFVRLVTGRRCAGLDRWFTYNRPCGGCGKSRKTSSSERTGGS